MHGALHCPAHAQNKAAHQQLLQVVAQYNARLEKEGPTRALITDLHKTASAWITEHILKVDTQLRQCDSKAPAPGPRPLAGAKR